MREHNWRRFPSWKPPKAPGKDKVLEKHASYSKYIFNAAPCNPAAPQHARHPFSCDKQRHISYHASVFIALLRGVQATTDLARTHLSINNEHAHFE
jgi:hypothetical protein